jgi:hypothetical protein
VLGQRGEIRAAFAERRAGRNTLAVVLDEAGGGGIGSPRSRCRRSSALLAGWMFASLSSNLESMSQNAAAASFKEADSGGNDELGDD